MAHALLAAMFGEEIAPGFLEAVYHETEGNPFFIEEVVKALIEAGKIFRADGRWQQARLEQLEIPQSVRVTIQARVGKLPAPAQETLRLAVILGREFDFATLQQASEQEEEALIAALESAERAQLISEVRDVGRVGRPAGERFAFAHALIPFTLRGSVSGMRRHRLHRRAAAAIERLRPDDFEALAYHSGEAGDEARARLYFTRAGDRARQLYANEDAIRLYTEALGMLPGDAPERFELLASRAAVYDLIAQRAAQRADVEAMLALAEALDDDTRRCDALTAQAAMNLMTDLAHTREPALRAVAIGRKLGDAVREGRALRQLGWSYHSMGEARQAREALEAAVARFREVGEAAEAAACLNMLALALISGVGDRAAAQQAAEEAVALSRKAGDRRQEATSLRRLAVVYGLQNRCAEELAFTEQALALNRALGDRGEERNALHNLGVIYARLGRMEESETYLRQALALAEASGSQHGVNSSVNILARYHFARRGEYEAALAFLDTHIARAREAGDELLASVIHGNTVEIYLGLGQFDRALAVAQDVWGLAQQTFGPTIQSHTLAGIAQLLAALGRFAEARQNIARAMELAAGGTRADSAWKWAALALVDLLEGEQMGDQAFFRAGLEHSRRALAVLTEFESEDDYADEIHTAARLCLHLGELEAALAYSTEMMRLMRTLPYVHAPSWYLLTHSQILRRLGREAEADGYLRQAYDRVQFVASKTQNESLWRSWRENVWYNREIFKEWSQRHPDKVTG